MEIITRILMGSEIHQIGHLLRVLKKGEFTANLASFGARMMSHQTLGNTPFSDSNHADRCVSTLPADFLSIWNPPKKNVAPSATNQLTGFQLTGPTSKKFQHKKKFWEGAPTTTNRFLVVLNVIHGGISKKEIIRDNWDIGYTEIDMAIFQILEISWDFSSHLRRTSNFVPSTASRQVDAPEKTDIAYARRVAETIYHPATRCESWAAGWKIPEPDSFGGFFPASVSWQTEGSSFFFLRNIAVIDIVIVYIYRCI